MAGGLLQGVDTYVFDGAYEIAPARESDAWQAGYRAGAIKRDIVLLVAAPGCGASLFVRVLRVASIKEQIEEFTTAAVNIASGEGTGWDYATVVMTPFGFLDDLFGLTFCFVPGTPVWTKHGTGVEYASAEGTSLGLPVLLTGTHRNALLSITLAGLGFAAAAACTRRRGAAEEEQEREALTERAGSINDEFFARWGRGQGRDWQSIPRFDYDGEPDESPFDNDHPMRDEALLNALAQEPRSHAWGAPCVTQSPRVGTVAPVVPALRARSRPSTPRKRTRGWPWAVLSALCFLSALGAWFLTGTSRDSQVADAVRSTPPTDAVAVAIEDLRLGQRVLGENPDATEALGRDPIREQSARIVLDLVMRDGSAIWMEAIWSRAEVAAAGAKTGARIPVYLSSLDAACEARVLALGECPVLEPGPGALVTARYITRVRDAPVVELRCQADAAPTFVTREHPYWSEDRQDFIAAGELRIGENVDTFAGPSPIIVLNRTTYTGCVYNVETTEHVYLAGPSGTLVHNMCARAARAGRAVQPAGQLHHVISTRIGRALQDHKTIFRFYELRDSRFVTRAIDGEAHRGYQRWHRELDAEVEQWLTNPKNKEATREQFEGWLRRRYARPDLKSRFPLGF